MTQFLWNKGDGLGHKHQWRCGKCGFGLAFNNRDWVYREIRAHKRICKRFQETVPVPTDVPTSLVMSQLKTRLPTAIPKGYRVFLHGSFVRQQAKKESDIDLLVVPCISKPILFSKKLREIERSIGSIEGHKIHAYSTFAALGWKPKVLLANYILGDKKS